MRHPEADLQQACVQLLQIYEAQDRLTYFHVPNGARLANPQRQGGRMKKLGVRPGVPDLVIVLPNGKTAWVELKSTAGKLSDYQQAWGQTLLALGHNWAIIRTVTELQNFIEGIE